MKELIVMCSAMFDNETLIGHLEKAIAKYNERGKKDTQEIELFCMLFLAKVRVKIQADADKIDEAGAIAKVIKEMAKDDQAKKLFNTDKYQS